MELEVRPYNTKKYIIPASKTECTSATDTKFLTKFKNIMYFRYDNHTKYIHAICERIPKNYG